MENEEPTTAIVAAERQIQNSLKIGYVSSDFFWFGESVPDELVFECLMCDRTCRKPKKDLLCSEYVFSDTCPECRRKALFLHDQKFWLYYKTLMLWEYELFADQFGDFYVAHTDIVGVRRIFLLKSDEMRSKFALILKNRAAIEQALLYLEGMTRRSGQVFRLDVRIATRDGKTWVDLCDDGWRAVCIDESGWRVVSNPPIIFKRYKHMEKMEIDSNGSVDDFRSFLELMNFQSPEDRILYTGFLVQGFIPDIDRPILMPTGPQGSAKTTLCIATRMVIDPSSLPTFGMDSDEAQIPQKILHHYLPTFDNCNHLSQEMSDLLCQASSGMGFSKRKLFTDMDDVVYSVRRAIILNGVSAPSMAPDLLDRTIMICLERITDEKRKKRSEIEAIRDSLLPKVRGYLLTIISEAMKEPTKHTEPLPRLADFCEKADDCLIKLGYEPGEFIRTYTIATRDIAEQAVQSDALANVLLELLEEDGDWKGTASNLLKKIEARCTINVLKSPGFPKTHNWLSEAICGRLKPGLQQLGWVVMKKTVENKRMLYIEKKQSGLLI
jgi:hypothetical protein